MNKFNYKLKETPLNLDSGNIIEDYLRSLGIEKIESFLSEPSIYDEESYEGLERIHELVDALHEGFTTNQKFFMQIDSDVDGFTSASIFYRYFKDLYPAAEIKCRVHNGKEHGIVMNSVPQDAKYIIIPDAGSNQISEQKELVRKGKKVLVIDHHLVDIYEEVPGAIVVNNQLSPKFKNKFLSGAGMVYKVIQCYSKKYGDNKHHQEYIDLAALGLISDMMDTRDLDNNFLIATGLKTIKNPMFKALLIKQSYSVSSVDTPNKIDVAFYITPLINAVIRVGTIEQNEQLFQGFTEYNHAEAYEKQYKGNVSSETFYEMIARMAYNIRNQQNKEKEKSMDFIRGIIEEDKLNENTVVTVISSQNDDVTVPKTMTGLVAMDIVKNYKKPAMLLRPRNIDGENYFYGSARANVRPGFKSFREVLQQSGLIHFAEGHDMAFGVGVHEDDLEKLTAYLNDKLKDIDFGTEEIEVDAILRGRRISHDILTDFAKYDYLYGMGIPQPKFAFEIFITRDMINLIGKERNTMKFNYNNIEFIKFNAKEIIPELFAETEDAFVDVNPKLRVKIIGRAQYNEFNGTKTLQIIMDNFNFEKSAGSDLI
jgi:single-stranded-DNA-specific exonuclease